MSYEKETIIQSDVDVIIQTLDYLKVDYVLTELGKVKALGKSDAYNGIDEYPIRKLEFGDKVILEKMIRTDDCDTNDTIISRAFNKKYVPDDWELEVLYTFE